LDDFGVPVQNLYLAFYDRKAGLPILHLADIQRSFLVFSLHSTANYENVIFLFSWFIFRTIIKKHYIFKSLVGLLYLYSPIDLWRIADPILKLYVFFLGVISLMTGKLVPVTVRAMERTRI
jgi:hypothetical protein